jgi:putative DNA primase/helicase
VNGLEATAEAHNDATLFLDELAQVNALDASETAYLLANGQGKGRMTKTLGAARKLCWNLFFVSTGELTLAEHAATAGKRTRGGAEVRLLNVDADGGRGMGVFEDMHGVQSANEFADELRNLTTRFYGAPFREFVKRLIEDGESPKELVRSIRECFTENLVADGATGEVRRAAARFALIGAAGELATSYGLTGWPENDALGAAIRCFDEWRTKRGTEGSSDEETAVRRVRRFIEAHEPSRFQRLPDDGQRIHNRAGFTRTHGGATEYLILREVFKTEVCMEYDYRMVANALHARGLLRRQGDEWTIKTTTFPGSQARVFAVSGSILADN